MLLLKEQPRQQLVLHIITGQIIQDTFIKDVELEIGGQPIDKHYSQWFDVWNELTDHDEKEWIGLNKHVAKNAYLSSSSRSY